ncbi:3-oxoacyl-[acyl-carrier protein] reductase [Asanoa ferruginea]|uniref:3-oxoacyl-[acyl-carrier protein] reductase n=1 Tax=Asanoa ferruginea TaxID=53367 RepID=A0A3D9ZVS8_9ACTN|nr:SDR family oxidoreductase [Asanoa ferruginea]REG00715.1 3-oxoacyl-[acyl-carrier protein] reductase [Asanoa ferruginea]GIF47411.1 3-oxoacyl-ACP reductase [Asanoa ferruginea]
MTASLTGRVALVTGASRGIGLAIAARLAAAGAKVCVTARKPDPLAEAVSLLGGPSVALGVAGRADDPEHRAAAVASATEAFGPIDILVNNTGINPVFGPLMEMDLGAARKIFEVNLLSALGWVQEVYGGAARPGVVVNVSSVGGRVPPPGISFYGITKAALEHLTRCLAVEMAPHVRVNAVAPAVVKTKFATLLYEGREDEVAASYPLARLGVPDDVAAAVAFLASSEAAWITGQTLVIDGGVTLTGRGA